MSHNEKIVLTFKDGNHRAYVIRDFHWEEFRAELWLDGEHQKAADYHTDDRTDAIITARHMLHKAAADMKQDTAPL